MKKALVLLFSFICINAFSLIPTNPQKIFFPSPNPYLYNHFSSSTSKRLTKLENQLINHINTSIKNASHHHSKITDEILNISGMSSPKGRHLLNNICSLPNTHYLEVGSWKGSTLVSALYNNSQSVKSAIAIDNFSEFNGPEVECRNNINHFLSSYPLDFYNIDCFKFDLNNFAHKINIYFYDGNHSPQSQELAFTYYNDILDDVFIAIVDDWNWLDVRIGTYSAFSKLNYEVIFERYLPSADNGDVDLWWDGLYVALIRKSK